MAECSVGDWCVGIVRWMVLVVCRVEGASEAVKHLIPCVCRILKPVLPCILLDYDLFTKDKSD